MKALRFIVLLGVVSLFSDVTYEGARAINGPFLALLGASGFVVSVVAGFGELIGYGLRLISGYVSDRTGRYWAMMLVGYAVNLVAVPLLALAGNWPLAAALMVTERVGKAIRTPARDAMISYASSRMGHGWGFGLHEALDQIGAILGPLIVAAVLYFRGGRGGFETRPYREGFAVLLIPAVLALLVLAATRFLYPHPQHLSTEQPPLKTRGLTKAYWLYLLAVAFVAAGFADFPLIAFHLKKNGVVPDAWVPLFYAVAMGVDALAALFFGKLFDKIGLSMLAAVTAGTALFAPFAFSNHFGAALFGVCLWGAGLGVQESVMRAAISGMVTLDKRATAFGIFNSGYGVAWFLGSAVMGFLYDASLAALIFFCVAVQAAAVPIFIVVSRSYRS